jgi:hypothetical protein
MQARTGDEWLRRSPVTSSAIGTLDQASGHRRLIWDGEGWGMSTERSQQLLSPLGVLARAQPPEDGQRRLQSLARCRRLSALLVQVA